MRSMQMMVVVGWLALGTACSDDKPEPQAADPGRIPGQQAAKQPAAQATPAVGSRVVGPRGEVIDGPLASDPDFRMPSPGVASRSPGVTAGSSTLDADTVRLALIEGIPGSGGSIQVQVAPGGNVSLSGEVASISEQQRAHYLARALPGVAEVDMRELRVR